MAHHVADIGRHPLVPAILEIPIVLENVADDFLLVGQDAQQIDHEHGVPDPLAVVVRPARADPGVLQGFGRRLEFFQNAFVKDTLRQCENLRVVRFTKLPDVHGFEFSSVTLILQ